MREKPVSSYSLQKLIEDDGEKGISAFIVEAGTDGLSMGEPEKKMGWKASDTRSVYFENMHIPADNILGKSITRIQTIPPNAHRWKNYHRSIILRDCLKGGMKLHYDILRNEKPSENRSINSKGSVLNCLIWQLVSKPQSIWSIMLHG